MSLFHLQCRIPIDSSSTLLVDTWVDFGVWLLHGSHVWAPPGRPTGGVELLGDKVCMSSALPGNSRMFSQWLYQFTLPPAAQEGFGCFIPRFLLCYLWVIYFIFTVFLAHFPP